MNIVHFLEKLPLLEAEFLEKIALPYMALLYLIDVYCTFQLCKKFKEPLWSAFIPFYNWKVVFKYCWNLKAFHEHLILEVLGLLLPFLGELFSGHDTLVLVISILDLIAACLALKHGIEIGINMLKAHGLDVKRNFLFIFILDIALIRITRTKYLGNYSKEHGA